MTGRRPIQMVFQDPYSSLDPRMTIGESIAEALPPGLGRAERDAEVGRLLGLVHLDPARARAYPGAPLGRAAPACRPRACPRRAAPGAHRRRDHLRPRRVDPGRGAQPGPRAPAGAGPLDPVHLPQPGRGALRGQPHRGHVPRAHRRVRHRARRPGPARSIPTPGTCWRRSRGCTGPPSIPTVEVLEAVDPHHPPPGCRYHTRCPIGPLVLPDREVCRERGTVDRPPPARRLPLRPSRGPGHST